MALKLSSLIIVSTIVCVSLIASTVAMRTYNEPHHAYNPYQTDDQITFPERTSGPRRPPTIRIEYFENGTRIVTYADGTPVVRPATATATESDRTEIESSTRLTGSTSRLDINTTAMLVQPKCLASDGSSYYCTKVQGYPRSLIENLVRANADSILFKSDKLDNEVDQRFGGEPNDEPLCEYFDEVIYPESGVTQGDIPFFIVNTEKQQGVRVERCRGPDQSCTSKINLPNGYKSVCRQNYVYRELISPSNDLTSLEKRKFKFPSCCSCMLQRTFD